MAKTQILDYYIHLRDQETAERLQAALAAGDSTPTPVGPGGLIFIPATGGFAILRAPDGAAIEFGGFDTPAGVLPLLTPTQVPPTTGVGYITSPWFGTSDSFQTNVATFTRSNGWWIFGGNTRFYWAGHVVYTPVVDTTPSEPTSEEPEPTEPAPFPLRLRVVGNEALGFGEYASDNANEGTPPTQMTRDASRGIEGFGFAMRPNTTSTDDCQITFETDVLQAWARGYIRPRAYPTAAVEIFRAEFGGGSAGQGFSIDINASGQLALYNNASTSGHDLVETAAPVAIGEWAKLDILLSVVQADDVASIKVYRRNALLFEATRSLGGVQGNRDLLHVQWGRGLAAGGSNPYVDFDDLMCAEMPKDKDTTLTAWSSGTDYAIDSFVRIVATGSNYRAVVASGPGNGGAVTPGTDPDVWIKLADGLDWLNGSKNLAVRALSAGADHANWTGDVRWLNALGDIQAGDALTSSTSGAIVDVLTDAEDVLPHDGVLGLAAIEVYTHARQATAGEGDIGFKYAGGAPVTATVNVGSGTLVYASTRANLTITNTPAPIDEIRLRYIKAANANAAVVKGLGGVVEVIGTFGPEDLPEGSTNPAVPIGRTLHNARWAQSPWARTDYALGPVIVVGGTYSGNGTAQDIAFPAPPAWIYIRPLTGGAGTSMFGLADQYAHSVYALGNAAGNTILHCRQNHAFVPASEDADQQMEFLVTVTGTSAQFNANGVTFQYIAFCDPAARFSRAGSVSVNTTLAVPWSHALEDAEFTPEWAFFQREDMGTTATVSMYTKGAGHGAAEASLISSGTAIASAITFAAGALSLGTGVISANLDGYGYTLFRRSDGNDDPDEAKVMAIGTYTGDGAASRTIALPTTGLRPLWAIVQPVTGAAAIVRDPSHTTNTSQTVNSGSTTTTGITAGSVDGFTVGSTLNSNGVVYNYLVFFASSTAGNGGWGTNGTYVPVGSDSPFPSDWAEPTEVPEPEEGEPEPDPNDPGELTTDIAANCLAASTRLCNMALSRIGITARLTSLADDDSVEADQFRLVYKTEIDAVLRAYPWQFATQYADLVHEDGVDAEDPVNGDWVHSYRLPSDCVFARRIVRPDLQRTYDSDPVAFRTFANDDRQLLYTNEPGQKLEIDSTWVDADDEVDPTQFTVNLEYTRRIDCPASRGDAVFRSCAAWRLASAVAMALGKDEKVAKWALGNFLAELPKAEVITAREQEHQDRGDGDPDWIAGR